MRSIFPQAATSGKAEPSESAAVSPTVSLILTTYEAPDLLERSLCGFAIQDHRDFDIVVADDGSGPSTRERIERLRQELGLPLRHVWHEDRGFRKTAILNKAILATDSEYLIFTDGDCIPRSDFVSVHLRLSEPGRYLAGGYFKLPRHVSESLDRDAVLAGKATDPNHLRRLGLRPSRKEIRLRVGPRLAPILDRITTTNRRWKGHNASGWREDLLKVNGFDERMTYMLEDVELGERLQNLGIRGKQIRHRAICVHLWHERGYARSDEIAANRAILEDTRRRGLTWTPHGLVKDC